MSTEIVVLTHPKSGASAQVLVSQGFNCFSWRAGPGELLYAPEGFDSGEGRASSGGCPLLFPFPGRIQRGRFTFEGKSYQIAEGDGRGNALHGFVFTRPWRILQQTEDSVTGEFQGSVDAPETLDVWPADYKIQVAYRLEATRLVCDVVYENPGDSNLPCGFGTHAYFRIPLVAGAPVEDTVLRVPLRGEWLTENLLPTGELQENKASEELSAGLRLGDWQFDSVFALDGKAGSQVLSSVTSGAWRLTQACEADFRCYVIYTPGHRQAVCIEPYTNLPDPFTLDSNGVPSGLAVLATGESRRHTLSLTIQRT